HSGPKALSVARFIRGSPLTSEDQSSWMPEIGIRQIVAHQCRSLGAADRLKSALILQRPRHTCLVSGRATAIVIGACLVFERAPAAEVFVEQPSQQREQVH